MGATLVNSIILISRAVPSAEERASSARVLIRQSDTRRAHAAPGKEPPKVRKGQGNVKLSREEFARRLGERFYDPAFDQVRAEIDRIIEVAWTTYDKYLPVPPRKECTEMTRAMPRRPSSARRRRPAQLGGAPLEILEGVRLHDLRPRGGQLVCITVYKCGAKELIRRLTA